MNMKREQIHELLYEITIDIDIVDRKMNKIIFPVDENNYADKNFLKLYSCSKQYNVLRKVCDNIIAKLNEKPSFNHKEFISLFENIRCAIPFYDFDTLEICPEAEDLKLKYIKYLKKDKINFENQTKDM